MNKTPTPRTDALEQTYRDTGAVAPWNALNLARELEGQLAELTDWKEQALAVEREWNPQNIGKLLKVPLGQSIRGAIEAGILHLLNQTVELPRWMPIDTAPKTGKRILAYDHGNCFVVHWEDCSGVSSPTPRMGWATHYDHECMAYEEEYPTHWQPLPPAPPLQPQAIDDFRK